LKNALVIDAIFSGIDGLDGDIFFINLPIHLLEFIGIAKNDIIEKPSSEIISSDQVIMFTQTQETVCKVISWSRKDIDFTRIDETVFVLRRITLDVVKDAGFAIFSPNIIALTPVIKEQSLVLKRYMFLRVFLPNHIVALFALKWEFFYGQLLIFDNFNLKQTLMTMILRRSTDAL
jgi:hypothetical protein